MKYGYLTISLDEARERLGEVYYDVERLVKGGLKRVLAATLNEAGQGAAAEAKRLVRARYAIKKGIVDKNFTQHKASVNNLRVVFRSRYARTGLHLSEFNLKRVTRKKRVRAVSVHVLQSSGRKEVLGAFVIKGRNSDKEILVKRVGKERWPIKTLYGPNMHTFLNRDENLDKLRAVAQARFEARFLAVAERLIQQALEKK